MVANAKAKRNNFCAFTLAEILIVLGIIGVVAALTIPSLIVNYQKKATVTKLQKFYSSMSQAIILSEIDNNSVNTWTYPAFHDGEGMKVWFATYMAKYIKYTDYGVDRDDNTFLDVYFADGSIAIFRQGTGAVDIHFFTDNSPTHWSEYGKRHFIFMLVTDASVNAFRPHLPAENATLDGRSKWTAGDVGCSTTGSKFTCAGLIIFEGWKIADDYPW